MCHMCIGVGQAVLVQVKANYASLDVLGKQAREMTRPAPDIQ